MVVGFEVGEGVIGERRGGIIWIAGEEGGAFMAPAKLG